MPVPAIVRFSLCVALVPAALADTPSLKAPNGIYERTLECHAIVGADVVPAPGERIEDAIIVIRDGVIEAIGTDISIPPEARVRHAEDMTIYPGLVEPALMVETADPPVGIGSHWNRQIRSQMNLGNPGGLAPLAESTRDSMRKAGYTVAAIHPSRGIFRGQGTVLPMAKEAVDIRPYPANVPMSVGFDRGGWGAGYPSSLMGSIALMRQTLMDARWHQACLETWAADPGSMQRPPRHDALVALQDVVAGTQPILVETGSLANALRAHAVAEEFGLDVWLVGSGDEYHDLDTVVALGHPIIVPIEFPDRPNLASLDSADRVTLRTMQEWEQAPTNLRRLLAADADIHVTSTGLGSPNEVRSGLRKAINTGGLDETDALALITTRPARLLGIEDQVGRIAPGMAAHLVVCTGDLFDKKTKIHEVWVAGTRHDYHEEPMMELAGRGTFTSGDLVLKGSIDTTKKSFSVDVPVVEEKDEAAEEGDEEAGEETEKKDTVKTVKAKSIDKDGHRFWGVIDSAPWDAEGWARFGGRIEGEAFVGRGRLADGTPFTFRFEKSDEEEGEDATDDEVEEEVQPDETVAADPVAGTWIVAMEIPNADFTPEIEINIERQGEDLSASVSMMRNEQTMDSVTFDPGTNTLKMVNQRDEGDFVVEAKVDGNRVSGTATSPWGEFAISGSRSGGDDSDDAGSDDDEAESGSPIPDEIAYPLGAFGRTELPETVDVRIENATIWTCGPAGIIEDGCLVTQDGIITWVGPCADAPAADAGSMIIDGTDLHITPGLIDCHSHTGITGGVNEGSEACTAEVRIGDVIDPEDIDWYRQLSGGLTACHQLHGSANPIGGQNTVVKLKWGHQAKDFRIPDAIPGIKFALGENVKRSTGRYPNTRMGVDAFMRDRFAAAQAYRDEWNRWNAKTAEQQAQAMPPRQDIEMDTLVEILEGRRLIHCHSYRQDEILALLRTAEEYGFTIGTLQHILEGYKVADAIADHGAGASSFSDWWAYKVEVMDAIPYNGSIMRDVGVNVSFNSDDNELATRMNDEAAKAVRYGGVPRAEALHFVTINPAYQLRIDHRTGSLETNKDADFVIWSEDPLSSYSRCLQTWIEGARYYDEDEDFKMREAVASERRRLTAKILAEAVGAPASPTPSDGAGEAPPPVRDGPPQRRRWRERPTEVILDFPYEDQDHRGVCGCNEVQQ